FSHLAWFWPGFSGVLVFSARKNLHNPLSFKNLSASFTRISPRINFGSSASRRAARVRGPMYLDENLAQKGATILMIKLPHVMQWKQNSQLCKPSST
ncbi:MAG: hypothetical protein RMJ60_09635, partial [Anaerolineales bacterium]|nr:hypothetical protein [Anaerolineales bacterium]